MTRLRARAPRGERASKARSRGTAVQEHHADRLHHSRRGNGRGDETVEGATDAPVFEAYIEHFLAPTLAEGQVVVLDGLGAHRTKKVRELVEARGAELLFLPRPTRRISTR